jgi:ketol-acid reductoisomerase
MANYFNTLNLREKLDQLGRCRFMDRSEFADGCNYLKGKKIVIVGCGAQGLNQGLNIVFCCAIDYKIFNYCVK